MYMYMHVHVHMPTVHTCTCVLGDCLSAEAWGYIAVDCLRNCGFDTRVHVTYMYTMYVCGHHVHVRRDCTDSIFLSRGSCTDSTFLKHKGCADSIFLSRRGCTDYIFLSR